MKKNKAKNKEAVYNPKPESAGFLVFCMLFLLLAFFELKLNFIFLNPGLKGTLFLIGLLLVPGYLLGRLLPFSLKSENIYTVLPVSFVFSLLLFIPFGLSGYWLNLTLPAVASLYLAAAIGMGIINLLVMKNKTAGAETPAPRPAAWFILLPLLASSLALHFGSWISGDFIHHMTNIRKLVDLPNITFTNYTLKGLPWPIYGHNIWHLFLSLSSRLSHTDPIVVWIFAGVFLAPIKVMAFYSSSKKIFDSEKIAALSTIIYIFSEAIMSYDRNGYISEQWYWSENSYPSHIARDIIFQVILYYIFCYIKEPQKKYLWLLPFLGAALALTHFYYMLMLFGMAACFLIMVFIFSREKSLIILKPFAAALLIGLPYAVWYSRILTTPTLNPIFFPNKMPWNNPSTLLWGKYPIFLPFKSLFGDPVYACATILAPFLFIRAKARLSNLFLLGIPTALLATFYNPPALMLLQKLNPALDRIFRVIEIFPAYWILGFFWAELTGAKKYIYRFVGKWLVGTVLAAASLTQADNLSKIIWTSDYCYNNYLQQAGFRDFIRPVIPPGSVVVMQQNYVWTWLTLLPYYPVVSSWNAHLPPYYDESERVAEQKRFLENRVDETSFKFLEKYNVDYIFDTQGKDYSPYQDRFIPVLSTQQWQIYRYKR